MAEVTVARIKSLYGELKGILEHLDAAAYASESQVAEYNSIIEELSSVSDSDYSRSKITDQHRITVYSDEPTSFPQSMFKAKLGSVVCKLEEEFNFKNNAPIHPTVVTVYNNQQMSISVTPVQQLIDNSQDDEIKAILIELQKALIEKKDTNKIKVILAQIMDKSWDVFLAVLPIILEAKGRSS